MSIFSFSPNLINININRDFPEGSLGEDIYTTDGENYHCFHANYKFRFGTPLIKVEIIGLNHQQKMNLVYFCSMMDRMGEYSGGNFNRILNEVMRSHLISNIQRINCKVEIDGVQSFSRVMADCSMLRINVTSRT